MRLSSHTHGWARLAAVLLSLAVLSGCPKPSPEAQNAQKTSEPVAAPAPAATPPPANTPAAAAPNASAPVTPPAAPAVAEHKDDTRDEAQAGAPGTFDPGQPDRSCKTTSDCAVKDVGSCCGYFPMCTNNNAKTDPKAVQAQCAKSGMASVCGFQEVRGCQCVQGRCENIADGAVVM